MAFRMGLVLGFSLIMAIGAQNLFLLKQGLKREYAYFCALVCSLCDVILISLSITSVDKLLTSLPMFENILLIAAIIFLTIYGGMSVYSAFCRKENKLDKNEEQKTLSISIWKILILTLSFSLLNPQAILDSMILIGGVASKYTATNQYEFMYGAILASVIWFFGIVTITRYLSKLLSNEYVWRILNFVSGSIMLAIAVKCFFLMK